MWSQDYLTAVQINMVRDYLPAWISACTIDNVHLAEV